MKHITMRTVFAEAVIGAAVCAGGYFLLVQPMEQEIARTRDEIAIAESNGQPQNAVPLAANDAQRLVNSTAGLRREIAARSSTALTEAGMFAAIVGMAETHSVQIDEVLPVALSSAPPAQAVPAAPLAGSPLVTAPPPPSGPTAHRGYSISAVGSYSALASFIRALQNDLGLTAVRSVRMRPDTVPGSTKVFCSIETEHWAITLPGQQTAAAQPPSADPLAKETGR